MRSPRAAGNSRLRRAGRATSGARSLRQSVSAMVGWLPPRRCVETLVNGR
jgi:hypothetical protein